MVNYNLKNPHKQLKMIFLLCNSVPICHKEDIVRDKAQTKTLPPSAKPAVVLRRSLSSELLLCHHCKD